MLRELTVHENILHSARVRLPCTWTTAEVEAYVDTIIDALKYAPLCFVLFVDSV